jgi:fumarylacetoacetase
MMSNTNSSDETHDPKRRSWVPGADAHPDFPIQNLPFGVFSPSGAAPCAGIAIGDSILDLKALLNTGLLRGDAAHAAQAAAAASLNAFMALGARPRRALRRALSDLLTAGSSAEPHLRPLLHASSASAVHLPATIGDYTDFYVGIHHATNVGKQFRPDNPLLPNYKHIPIGYHGRSSTVRPSGTPIRRPNGQTKAPDAAAPEFGPCRRLDFELELGVWIGPGNYSGEPIPIAEAADHIAGYCLLNDWSARDIQAWEYQPLGPFLAKNFAATISPWIVTPEALAPFRMAQPPRPPGDPSPLPYLLDAADQRTGALALDLEVWLQTPGLREKGRPPHHLSTSNTRHMYWTTAQLVAHHTSGGCELRPGDLLGTGTLSGTDPSSVGSIIEATLGGRQPLILASGEERRFLEDGDEVLLRARASRDGFVSIGFGDCRGTIAPAIVAKTKQ